MTKFIFNCLEVVPGTLSDFRSLAGYHYRTEAIWAPTDVFKIRAIKECRKAFPDPIAVIVYRMPLPDLRARTKATNGYFHAPKTQSERLTLVNHNIRYIARIIVDPRFRRLNLATELLLESLKRQTVPIVETLIPLDWTNKLFLKAGFKLYPTPAPTWYRRFTAMLKTIGLDDWNTLLPSTLHERLESLDDNQAGIAEHEIQQFLRHFRHRRTMQPGIERCKYILSKISFPEAYLIWHNPRVPLETLVLTAQVPLTS